MPVPSRAADTAGKFIYIFFAAVCCSGRAGQSVTPPLIPDPSVSLESPSSWGQSGGLAGNKPTVIRDKDTSPPKWARGQREERLRRWKVTQAVGQKGERGESGVMEVRGGGEMKGKPKSHTGPQDIADTYMRIQRCPMGSFTVTWKRAEKQSGKL